jgi:hypothetical protein
MLKETLINFRFKTFILLVILIISKVWQAFEKGQLIIVPIPAVKNKIIASCSQNFGFLCIFVLFLMR